MNFRRAWWASILLLALLYARTTPSAAVTHAELVEPMQRALDFIYNMEFESALHSARGLLARAPEHPAGFFTLAATYWQQRLVTIEAQQRSQLLEQFQDAIQRAQTAAAKLPEAQAAEAAFYLGAAYGMQARMHFLEKHYIRALIAAKQGSMHLQHCVTLVPLWYDAYAGLGTYYYVLARVPGFWRGIVQRLIGIPGDRAQGLYILEQARSHGQLSIPEASLLLAKIYMLPDEMQYGQAAHLLTSLVQRYPNNIDYRYRLGLVLAALGRWQQAQHLLRDLLTELTHSTAPYAQQWLPVLSYRLAETALFQRELSTALDVLMGLQGQEIETTLRAWVELRLGNVHDLRNEPQAARVWYRGVTGEAEAERLARLYASRPFTPAHVVIKAIEQSAI